MDTAQQIRCASYLTPSACVLATAAFCYKRIRATSTLGKVHYNALAILSALSIRASIATVNEANEAGSPIKSLSDFGSHFAVCSAILPIFLTSHLFIPCPPDQFMRFVKCVATPDFRHCDLGFSGE